MSFKFSREEMLTASGKTQDDRDYHAFYAQHCAEQIDKGTAAIFLQADGRTAWGDDVATSVRNELGRIRFHIVALQEAAEYLKGTGFERVFNKHLDLKAGPVEKALQHAAFLERCLAPASTK